MENSFSTIITPNDIRADIKTRMSSGQSETGHCEIGMFNIKSANQTIAEAAARPNPKKMWFSLWQEGELSCLFADSNLGKSVYATQIGVAIASTGKKVLLFDLEMSDKQFQLRYTDAATGQLFKFPETFYRVEMSSSADIEGDFEECIVNDIERCIEETGSRVVIVDNLTWLAGKAEKGDVAAALMQRLSKIKNNYGASMLIVSHTNKRDLSRPLTQNDLTGSKKLYNFFDGVFAIGPSSKGETLRYVKQLKNRTGEIDYGSDNVMLASLEKIGAFLCFRDMGFSTEREHLRERSQDDEDQMDAMVKANFEAGLTIEESASKLGIGKSTVQRREKRLGLDRKSKNKK